MARSRGATPADSIKLTLDPALLTKLDAFCNINRGKPARVGIIRDAIEAYIETELGKDVPLSQRHGEEVKRLEAERQHVRFPTTARNIRLLPATDKERT